MKENHTTKTWKLVVIVYLSFFSSIFLSCSYQEKNDDIKTQTSQEKSINTKTHNSDFNDYWYNGLAEISYYDLSQARYGEIHTGTATLIYVTENFIPQLQVKADSENKNNIPILKLNSFKNFKTGVYPYSIMNSSFHAINSENLFLKNSLSIQEWCGNTFVQVNSREHYEVQVNSYFENFHDRQFTIEKDWLENEIWTLIRINPNQLPIGKIKIIPSIEFLSLRGQTMKSYNAIAKLHTIEGLSVYELAYPELNRSLKISFSYNFPHIIERWEETCPNKFSMPNSSLTTVGKRISTVQNDYWNYNSVADSIKLTEIRNVKQITKTN